MKSKSGNKHLDDALNLEFGIPVTDKLAIPVDKDLKDVPEGYALFLIMVISQHICTLNQLL